VEAQEDMPSIVRMSTKAKGPRRKPAIGHMVNMQKTIETGEKPQGEFKRMVSEADTTADEASDDQWSQHTESTQASPVTSCQPPPQQPEAEISAWPALPAADLTVPGQADAQAKTSHCEMALRFVDECKEEKAAGQRRRAKRADAARSAREATAWRTSFRRRRQKALAAKKAQWAKARGDRQQVRRDDEEGAPAASSVEDVAADRGDIKAMRAMTRATNLHMKRTEYNRERSLRDWTWGRGIEEAKPHRGQRTALRACLAKGVVEAQEDMPSIVRMSAKAKGPRRKPAIAHRVQQNTNDIGEEDVDSEPDVEQAGASESKVVLQEAPASGSQKAPQQLVEEPAAWPALPHGGADESQPKSGAKGVAPAKNEGRKGGNCIIS